jgi:mono/diheme cytochrome c family protein
VKKLSAIVLMLLLATFVSWGLRTLLPNNLELFITILIYVLFAVPVWGYFPESTRVPLIILVFTAQVTLFYNYVGQLVPQSVIYPPEDVKIGADMTTEQMVEAGRKLYEGKGTCLNCHGTGARFPDLVDIGQLARTRISGYTDVEYFSESLYEPDKFIVEPFAPGMPPVHKPPIGLTHEEILTVIAYLQSLGGTPTVTMKTELKYHDEPISAPVVAVASEDEEDQTGEQLVAAYGCLGCHSFDSPDRMLGPSLYDIGSRMNKAEIYESLMEPDEVIAEGYPPGVMGATLTAMGFYDKVTTKQLKTMVDYLMSLKGDNGT